MLILKQSTAVDVLIGPFLDSTNAYDGEGGLSPAVRLSKNGQALAAKSDVTTPTHDEDGYYNCELDATDTNTVGTLVLKVAGSATALPVRHEFQVVEEATYDALFGASANGFNAGGLVTLAAVTHTGAVIPTVSTLTGHTPQTGDSFARIGVNGAGLSNIDLPNQTMDITGNLSGSVGSVTGAVGSVTGNVGGSVASVTGAVGSVTGAVGSVTTVNDKSGYSLSAAGVDAILDEAITEPSAPFTWGGASLRSIVGWLGALGRNKFTQTATTQTLRNDADNADVSTASVADDGTTFTRGEWS